MAYDNVKREYAKEHLWYVEIEVDGTVYRFCENRAPVPWGLEAQPTSQSVSVNPAEIDLSGGIGVRASCSLSFVESDDYSIWGSIQSPERFWARWRAENPYYLGKRISVFSGYIVNNTFSASNFVRRDYIIESFSQAGAGVSVKGKDPLKLLSNDRAKAPVESNGSLSADILETDTSFTLQPAGIGDSEYPASNGIVRIGDEVILYTTRSGDAFSGLTRGFYNTEVGDHSENDTAQLCLQYSTETVSNIGYDLMTNYASVDPSFINKADWDAEVGLAFNTTYSILITEPTGVQDLLSEFCDSAPHYYFYDERVNKIRLVALKPPPDEAQLFTYEANIIAGTTAVKDRQDLRISTVIVNYGIIDPTKDLDETSNYRSSYVREDSASVTNYGQRAYKTVHSRWIPSDNKTAAVLMAARVGRRFSDAPREISFSLDAKDSDVWTGDSIRVMSDLIMQQGGGFATLPFQITSAGENKNFNYTALEHTYGDSAPGDEDVEEPNTRLIYFSGEIDRLENDEGTAYRTLREVYEDVFGTDPIDPDLNIKFIFDSNAVAGSSDNTEYSVNTGAWPELTTPILIQNSGLIVGRGGVGANIGRAALDGGPALRLQANIRLNNLNIIGGGGGGGDSGSAAQGGVIAVAGGGGGAGYTIAAGGGATSVDPTNSTVSIEAAESGTYTEGGKGGIATAIDGSEVFQAIGRKGGGLGSVGAGISRPGGDSGKAIDLNGFAITYINTGTILGDVS
jgi:hypothetical protein